MLFFLFLSNPNVEMFLSLLILRQVFWEEYESSWVRDRWSLV